MTTRSLATPAPCLSRTEETYRPIAARVYGAAGQGDVAGRLLLFVRGLGERSFDLHRLAAFECSGPGVKAGQAVDLHDQRVIDPLTGGEDVAGAQVGQIAGG